MFWRITGRLPERVQQLGDRQLGDIVITEPQDNRHFSGGQTGWKAAAIEEVGLIPAFGLHPCGAALRAVFASSRRSNCGMLTRTAPGVLALRAQPPVDLPRGRPAAWFIIPASDLRIRFAD